MSDQDLGPAVSAILNMLVQGTVVAIYPHASQQATTEAVDAVNDLMLSGPIQGLTKGLTKGVDVNSPESIMELTKHPAFTALTDQIEQTMSHIMANHGYIRID